MAFTADGPRPHERVAAEMSRIAAQSGSLRASAVMAAISALLLTGFVVLLAASVPRRGLASLIAVMAIAVFWTLDLVSQAALAASAQSADTHLGPAAVMGLGHLHSTSLLLSLAPLGGAVAALAIATPRRRFARWTAYLIAVGGVLSIFTLLGVDLDTGPFSPGPVIVVMGLPIWVAAISIGVLRGLRATRLAPAT